MFKSGRMFCWAARQLCDCGEVISSVRLNFFHQQERANNRCLSELLFGTKRHNACKVSGTT